MLIRCLSRESEAFVVNRYLIKKIKMKNKLKNIDNTDLLKFLLKLDLCT